MGARVWGVAVSLALRNNGAIRVKHWGSTFTAWRRAAGRSGLAFGGPPAARWRGPDSRSNLAMVGASKRGRVAAERAAEVLGGVVLLAAPGFNLAVVLNDGGAGRPCAATSGARRLPERAPPTPRYATPSRILAATNRAMPFPSCQHRHNHAACHCIIVPWLYLFGSDADHVPRTCQSHGVHAAHLRRMCQRPNLAHVWPNVDMF